MDGANIFCFLFSSTPEADRSRVLVHDADWNGAGLFHLVSNESLADQKRLERGDGLTAGGCFANEYKLPRGCEGTADGTTAPSAVPFPSVLDVEGRVVCSRGHPTDLLSETG